MPSFHHIAKKRDEIFYACIIVSTGIMNRTATTERVHELMQDFAGLTGLDPPGARPQRYRWTDAFAVCPPNCSGSPASCGGCRGIHRTDGTVDESPAIIFPRCFLSPLLNRLISRQCLTGEFTDLTLKTGLPFTFYLFQPIRQTIAHPKRSISALFGARHTPAPVQRGEICVFPK